MLSERKWAAHFADCMSFAAPLQVAGRLASRIAPLLLGKHKPTYGAQLFNLLILSVRFAVPSQDHGDYVVVVNSDKILFTGKKEKQKFYYQHSTWACSFGL